MPEIEIPEIREIAPPLPPDTAWPLFVWLLIALGAILLVALLVLLFLKRKPPATAGPKYDPRDSSLTKLHDLKENFTSLPATEFALQASNALREYLTGFYGLTTPFETGKEFLGRQDRERLMDEVKFGSVSHLFTRAETLKYAPAPGADSERLDLVQDMIKFVRDDVPGPKLHAATTPDSDTDADPIPA